MDLSDDIAYSVHDVEDGVVGGWFSLLGDLDDSAVFDVAAIGVACALGYIDLRMPDFGWREQQPKLAAWYAEVSQRESMKLTAPPVA